MLEQGGTPEGALHPSHELPVGLNQRAIGAARDRVQSGQAEAERLNFSQVFVRGRGAVIDWLKSQLGLQHPGIPERRALLGVAVDLDDGVVDIEQAWGLRCPCRRGAGCARPG